MAKVTVNKFGLSRHIPDHVKRDVRRRCKFGCVSCGKGIIQYDHFNPEFAHAKEHLAEGITLLCGSCHDEKRHGLLTNQQITALNADPYCSKHGNAFGQFRLAGEKPVVLLGTSEIRQCKVVLEIAGEKVLWFTKPEDPDEGLTLNARIRGPSGRVILEIIRNEWIVGDNQWDINTSGNGIVVRSRARKFALILRFLPPETLRIERADFVHRKNRVRISKDGSIIDARHNIIKGCTVINCYTGIRFLESGSIQIGCGRPKSLDFILRLKGSTSPISLLCPSFGADHSVG